MAPLFESQSRQEVCPISTKSCKTYRKKKGGEDSNRKLTQNAEKPRITMLKSKHGTHSTLLLEVDICFTSKISSIGDTGNGGYGIYILLPDGSTSRLCRPLGEKKFRFDWEKQGCHRVSSVTRRHHEVSPHNDVVIFTDCRAFLQALEGSGKAIVGQAVLLADSLRMVEGVRAVVQWLLFHVRIIGYKITNALTNEAKFQPQ
ncbi:hypothetical protein PoB_001675800 [Plakobranchus ocellatus]|uniref:RNase H type-1 domain-containing protein n=1 Tax=Plakobranchus ocellatus TaxID=259542 RepID=A0AAV3Z6M8_9GAST|nr:hypothetical protein PoB_001675800 [Plakobranchus ocellatus]